MAHGTLENLSHSSFVRTPPHLATRIYENLLSLPAEEQRTVPHPLISILDPAAGEGDLLLPLLHLHESSTCRFSCTGIEISADRATTARTRLMDLMPTILPNAFEGVKLPANGVSLAILNPPYFLVNGRRAEYQFVTRTTPALVDDGILVTILPARSAWDQRMATFWSRWFDGIQIWKMPSLEEGETESPFEKYTQIVVVGRKRAIPRDLDEKHIQALLAYRWRKDPKNKHMEGWAGQVPPPTLPTTPISHPYQVPVVSSPPFFDVQNADDALILQTLLGTDEQSGSGAHLSTEWAQATTWQEDAALERPAMPYTGVAHVAAEIMTGMLGGEVIELDGTPYLLTAFVGSEWSKMTLDGDTKENLRTKGVVKASAKELQDYPVLGVLNLTQGRTLYYEGNAVFDFLAPWIGTLSAYAQQKRPPLYQLDPEDWELDVLTQFGTDKQLPNAPFPGLAPAQMHRVCAMGRTLDTRGLVAIQGEPGTGKTRMAVATAARQAYEWRWHATWKGKKQPAWMRNLRRTWLKNPRTLAMLHLEPVYGERLPDTGPGEAQIREDVSTGQIVAYRRTNSGVMVLPEQAGPTALPVLVATPKKVTKEYEKEIQAAWPDAETILVRRYQDIVRWLERCAFSQASAVIAICSHSQSQPQGSGRSWEPAIREKWTERSELVLHPDEALFPLLDPMCDEQDEIIGYRLRESGEPLTELVRTSHYYCPECFGLVQGVPDRLQAAKRRQEDGSALLQQEEEQENESLKSPVTSRTWFEKKQRWCTCQQTRNTERVRNHRKPLRSPLWTQSRVSPTQQKYPTLAYRDWAHVVDTCILPLAQQRHLEGTEAASATTSTIAVTSQHARSASRITATGEGMASMHVPNRSNPALLDHYDLVAPPPDSFGVYEYLIRFFKGCVGLSIIDESHNGRSQNSDIARALHRAMRAAQCHMLTSGTHYGGDVHSFYFYWYRFNPQFWKRLGLSWKQASEALKRYGVIQMWVKEFESDARRGSGKSTVQVSTVPAPGLSAKLLPYLLEDLCFLTVLDVGAFMPPKIEIPEIVSMHDPVLEEKMQQAEAMVIAPRQALNRLYAEKQELFNAVRDGLADPHDLQVWSQQEEQARQALDLAQEESAQMKEWVKERDLCAAYLSVVTSLAERARKGNQAARMAQGTIPRWFAILPFEKPYELWQTKRSSWGDEQEKTCLLRTPQLTWNYVYPLERRLIELVQQEVCAGRRLMLYIDQNQERSTARRLEWVLHQAGIASWTLPNTVKPEDWQQRIIEVMSADGDQPTRVQVAIVPYSRVNEGINLQSVIDSILWYEMALNLFMLEQASRRAWRLGKREEVHIYYLAYAGTAGHQKMRKLGSQSGAAAAFAGEPARGALIEEAGADRTTLARFSETVEAELLIDEDEPSTLLTLLNDDDRSELAEAFVRRANEERTTLQRGRSWLGAVDTLPERLPAFFAEELSSVWIGFPAKNRIQVVDARPAAQPVRTEKPATLQQEKQRVKASLQLVKPESGNDGQSGEAHHIIVSAENSQPMTPLICTTLTPDTTNEHLPKTLSSPAKELVFGNEEHIQLARKRSKAHRKHGTTAAPKQPRIQVAVREIPAIDANVLSPLPVKSLKEPKSKAALTTAPMKTLWDFVGEQAVEQTTKVSPIKPPAPTPNESARGKLSSEAFNALLQEAKTSPKAYQHYRQYCHANITPVQSNTVVYATWQVGETWAIRYFVDDQAPTEHRYSGFQNEEDATTLLHHAAPGRVWQRLTFKEFSANLVARVQNENMR